MRLSNRLMRVILPLAVTAPLAANPDPQTAPQIVPDQIAARRHEWQAI
jgi:hypothetical protein